MKKHKSVVAILLAVMMIFTMMPTMAFASVAQKGTDDVWADDFSTVNGYATVRTWNGDGSITAAFDPTNMSPSIVNANSDAMITYYDLDNSFVTMNGSQLYSTYSQSDFEKLYDTKENKWVNDEVKVVFTVPSYVDGYADMTSDQKKATATSPTFDAQWKATLSAPEGYVSGSKEDQPFTLATSLSTDKENTLYSKGSVPVVKITVKGVVATPNSANFYFDSLDGAKFKMDSLNTTYYDGAAHTVVADEVAGWTVSYATFNSTTGKYDDVTAVSLSDVQEKAVKVRATWKQAGQKDVEKFFSVNLKAAGIAYIGFDEYLHTVEGTTYNAADYVVPYANVTYKKTMEDDEKEAARALDTATASAVEANKADLIAYFNELYDVVAEVSEFNPNRVDLTIDDKDLTSKEKTAIAKKYAALLARFGKVAVDGLNDEAVVGLNGVDLTDYEIEFTNVPAKKVIKTKKAKSTKKVTFNATAECKNGTFVKYKLINAPKKNITIDANTGKITVKKGTPVGTYTFEVKAYIPGSRIDAELYGGTYVSEKQTVKVIVKKTKKAKKK